MQIISKRSLIQIEFTADEVEALKKILNGYNGLNYQQFINELKELIS